jgi:hypothetical protein
MRPTLIFVRHTEFGDRAFPHAAELPPDFLPPEAINRLLDSGRLRECRERRSLHRLFSEFSGCQDTELLSDVERTAYALPP